MSKVFYRDENVMLIQGDCLEVMPKLKRKFDAIITDPPYGTTVCRWDTVIPFDKMWKCVNLLIKDNGAILLFGSQPFTTVLNYSNLKFYRYEWIWIKNNTTGFQLANKMPLKKHEIISVFYKKLPTYNPQGLLPYGKTNRRGSVGNGGHLATECNEYTQEFTNYPTQILEFKYDVEKFHPTQKPVALLEYLIKTYTNEGETVLDFTSGSGTALIAALNTGRRAVGIEMDEKYCQITVDRIKAYYASKENKA